MYLWEEVRYIWQHNGISIGKYKHLTIVFLYLVITRWDWCSEIGNRSALHILKIMLKTWRRCRGIIRGTEIIQCKKPRRVEYFKELKLCFTNKKIEIGTVNLMKEKVLHIYKPNDLAEKARTRTKSCVVDTREILVTEHLFLRDCEKNIDADYQWAQ